MPRRYGSPTAHTNGGEGGDQNTTFPRSDRGVFRTFPSARAPPTIPVPRGLDPVPMTLFQNFDPRHHTKWAPGGLQSTATPDRHHRLLDLRRWLRCLAPVRAGAARPLRAI